MRTLTLACAIGSGMMAGVFFAFSSFVMPGLAKTPPPAAVSAMQGINVAAVTPAFMLLLFGTAGGCVALLVSGVRAGGGQRLPLIAGAVSYFGAIAITVAFNVPRNDALASLDPQAAATASYWHDYLIGWTAANHARTATSLAAAILFAIAYREL